MATLAEKFEAEFGHKGSFHVRCPGRVNIIGEHIDYSGYGVLPMAVEHSVQAVVGVSREQPHGIHLRNADSEKYPAKDLPWGLPEFSGGKPTWDQYFLCGVRGIFDHLGLVGKPGIRMEVMLSGSVPPSAGLSSSSALVCCAALSTLRAVTGTDLGGVDMSAVAEICAKAERHIGTEGGGMDQAISMLAQAGKAAHIQFHPLRMTPVTLPDGAKFVICHSGVEMNKAATSYYNERVVECRIAAKIIAKANGLDVDNFKTLGQVQEALGLPLSEMGAKVEAVPVGPLSREQVAVALDFPAEEFEQRFLNPLTAKMEKFFPRKRAQHVYEESNRVLEFAKKCAEGGAVEELGRLMTDSHASCRDLYECSCKELDAVVEACCTAGALGSRLTGAGWGGCTVSLVKADHVDTFLSQISDFYSTPQLEKFKDFVFVSSPAAGGSVTEL